MGPFQRVQSSDRELNQVQSNISFALAPIVTNPAVFGILLTGQALIAGATTLNHGLGRALQGWIVVRQRASAIIWDSQDANTTPDSTLILNSSAAVTVDLYLF